MTAALAVILGEDEKKVKREIIVGWNKEKKPASAIFVS